MQIILSDVLGFCFGVSRAIKMAEEALAEGRPKNPDSPNDAQLRRAA